MKKNILIFSIIILTQKLTFSSEEALFMKKNLLDSFNTSPGIVAYMKDILTTHSSDNILEDVISPNQNHHGINFKLATEKIFNKEYWVPKKDEFEDENLKNIFSEYVNKSIVDDYYHIFVANLLYVSGSNFYKQEKNSEFLEYAASIGHDKAQYAMFSMALKSKKFPEARNYLLSAASQGNHEALLKLSEIYQGGYLYLIKCFPDGLNKPNLEIARKLCEMSANLGNDQAIFRINVSTLTEGFFNSKIDYQKGIRNAKELADKKNKRAEEFINSIMNSSEESILEGNDSITRDDLIFLSDFLKWKG